MEQANPLVAKELKKVVRCLISFIVRDGKELVADGSREEYVKRYLYRLSKSMNGVNECITSADLERYIEEDVINYMKIDPKKELEKIGMKLR